MNRQHTFICDSQGWVPSRVGTFQEIDASDCDLECDDGMFETTMKQLSAPLPLNAQQAVEAEADIWKSLWSESCGPLPLQWPEVMGPRPPIPIVDELIAVCKTSPAGTGLGWNGWHPRALIRLPVELLRA